MNQNYTHHSDYFSGKSEMSFGPLDFELEGTSIWSFPQRGNWATHDSRWRGNWSPYVVRNLILRYSQEGDLLLDQFAGGGTTLVEAKLTNRNIIGIDVNDIALKRCKNKVNFYYDRKAGKVEIRKNDACNLNSIEDNSIDFICTHPPYGNMIKYSKDLKLNIPEDLSNLNDDDFFKSMAKVAKECFRVLKNNKYCAILMGDKRKNGHIVPLSFEVAKIFQNTGFLLKEVIIKQQHNCKATGFWKQKSLEHNFLLISHEYLFVFHKL